MPKSSAKEKHRRSPPHSAELQPAIGAKPKSVSSITNRGFVGLKSSFRPIIEKTLWSFDTENNTETGELLQISATDGERYYHFTEREPFIKWLYLQFNHSVVFLACNLEYDLINIFSGRWDLLELKLKNFGLSIVSARLKGTKILFYDTLNHFPFGVKAMGERIALPKLEMDLTGWDYCDRDALIPLEYCRAMQERYNALGANFNATLPSSSLDLFRRRFLKFNVRQPSIQTLDLMFEAYYGGRVEIFNTKPFHGPLYYIDVNSMYPGVMRDAFPNPNDYRVDTKLDISGFGIVACNVQAPGNCYIPALPYRANDKLLFPVGSFAGAWTKEELRFAAALGYQFSNCKWAVHFPTSCYPFVEFVDVLYERKENAPDEIERYVAKLFLNSLYGKMGERIDQSTFVPLCDVPPDKTAVVYGAYAFVQYGKKYAPHTNGIWAILTTARARLLLTQTMQSIVDNGGVLYYCDTDSIVYAADKPLHVNSTKLGEWKLEAELDFVHFVQPKFYAYRERGKDLTVKAKGVPRNCAARYYDERRCTFSRPYRLRSILKKGLPGSVWFETCKTQRSYYDKRKTLASGETYPIRLKRPARPQAANHVKGK